MAVYPSMFLLLFLLFCPSAIFAQSLPAKSHRNTGSVLSGNVPFRQLTIEDGLPSNYVRALMQDSRGFMWFGTLDGLARYDGHEMVVYQHDPRDSTTLSNNWIYSLCEDHTGAIWIGTHHGLNRLDPLTGNIKRYYFNPPGSTGPNRLKVFDIYEARDSSLWVSVFGEAGGLYRYDRRRDAFIGFHHDPDDSTTLSTNLLQDIVEDRFGYLWIGAARGGINRFDPKTGRVMRFLQHTEIPVSSHYGIVDSSGNIWFSIWSDVIRVDPRTLKVERIRLKGFERGAARLDLISIFQDSRGSYWIIGDPVGHFHPETGTFRPLPLSPDGRDRRYTPWRAIEDRSHNLWIATLSGGVFRRDLKPQYITHYRHNPYSANSLNSDDIRMLHESRNGDLWIVTIAKGICRFDPETETFQRYVHDPQDPTSLGDNLIYAMLEDHTGTMWFGTFRGGLNRFNPETGDYTRFSDDPTNPTNLASRRIWSLAEDNEGNIWIGTGDNVLQKFNPRTQRFTTLYLKKFPKGKNKKINWRVWQIFRGKSGYLWVHAYGDDLYRVDPRTYEVVRIQRPPDFPYPFRSVILQSRDGRLWGGNGALLELDPGKHTFQAHLFGAQSGSPRGFNYVSDIFEDDRGVFWCATGNGLYQFDPLQRKIIAHYTQADGLPSNILFKLLPGDKGELWLATSRGLSIFRPDATPGRQFENLSPEQGVVNSWVGKRKALIKTSNGDIYWGGDNGLYRFHTGVTHANPYAPPVRPTGFRLFNQPMEFDTSIAHIKTIHLPYDQNFFSFKFAALEFTNPKQNRYAYRLEGFDDAWRDSGNRNQAEYTNVPPGTYTFRVRAANNDGVWNEEGASVRIIISPPWWRTGWAYAGYLLFIALLMYSIRRFELNRLHLRHELKRREFEARKLQEMDELKSRFFANISHEFRTPLTLILGPLDTLLSNGSNGETKQMLHMMRRNALRLQRLINQLLDLSKLQAGRMTLRVQRVNLVAFVRALVMAFASLAERKRIQLSFNSSPEEIWAYVDRDKVEKIVSNLISNALKFTGEGGSVTIQLRTTKHETSENFMLRGSCSGFTEITVSDTGIGIPAEKLPHIFDRFYQVDDSVSRDQEGTGIGLSLVKELVEMHHGKIEVSSTPGQGSTFSVFLPSGKDHFQPHEIVEAEMPEPDVSEPNFEDAPASGIDSPINKAATGNAPLVLVVEDNTDVRSYIRGHLQSEYRIVEAQDGSEGFERAVDEMPDLIISDVMMPGMDGFALCRKLKSDPHTGHIPVILLTARASGDSKIEGLETGADDYVIKPFDVKELQVRVKNLIEQRQRLRERFLREFMLESGEVEVISADNRFLHRALRVVEAHLNDPEFTVEEFTREVGLSAMQLHRKLKALTGQSASGFIRMVRLKRAARLIEKGFGNITEIAYEVGFNNPSYFAARFREVFGISPKAYAAR